ncbi:phospholipid methyltransferase family protein [Heterostelium album PN500]|uniref:Phosphatidylethanolamine N-methyltransferase n=1 Tax=Heterostelium pallidum (strain ATCC 26659 / Pp 5 / PN500) TaxID=670386 RepID=D3BN57_HETP5|nr:phospholipid methyltransferase family protein [Heterostelium album PN500]EFA77419.1 phospholipid methyltransferase family protein [Heterostelium album PN500]|eukprot:XP_020429548.1 phospholipid methyltransferase family protein [Heterostelium album PN500]
MDQLSMQTLLELPHYIDFQEKYLWYTILVITSTPTWWNIVARREYKTHFLTKLCGGAYKGCYFLAFLIFTCGALRDYLFAESMKRQPIHPLLEQFSQELQTVSYALYAIGGILVGATYYRLGITGTYLGDYFGILMKERVYGFPFNVMSNPMYNGSTILFLAHALHGKSVAGIFLSLIVFITYRIALTFEEPFTAHIYSKRTSTGGQEQKRSAKKIQ